MQSTSVFFCTRHTSEVALLGELPQMICMVCANFCIFLCVLASSLDVGVSGGCAAQSGCSGQCARTVVVLCCSKGLKPKLSWVWQQSNRRKECGILTDAGSLGTSHPDFDCKERSHVCFRCCFSSSAKALACLVFLGQRFRPREMATTMSRSLLARHILGSRKAPHRHSCASHKSSHRRHWTASSTRVPCDRTTCPVSETTPPTSSLS